PSRDLIEAVRILAKAPIYKPIDEWLDTAFEVWETFDLGNQDRPPASLGIPTWLYGHEPPTIFATHIAKYFANSVREDGLVTIARAGIIYTPGSAGTVQEIFQDATQNHYETLGEISPMLFFGMNYWTDRIPVVPLLKRMAGNRKYKAMIGITDSPEEVIRRIEQHASV
ncbi:MAG: hypothetical protein AAF492_18055, partial [Verrucomicrobiota bacterium]